MPCDNLNKKLFRTRVFNAAAAIRSSATSNPELLKESNEQCTLPYPYYLYYILDLTKSPRQRGQRKRH